MKEWVIPEAGAEFVCAMEDVLEVYERPYDEKRPVVCFDESPKQLVSEVRKPFMDSKGAVHEDCEYKREGAAEVFMVVEPLGKRREVFVEEDHTGTTWARIVAYIAEEMYPGAEQVTLIEDNLSSHKKSNLYKVFGPERARAIIKRVDFVYTPKHGSWLNIAESELSVLSRQAVNGRVESREELEGLVKAWAKSRNTAQKGVIWQFTIKDARTKLKKLYPTVLI